jgi:sentrin-specific protease 1
MSFFSVIFEPFRSFLGFPATEVVPVEDAVDERDVDAVMEEVATEPEPEARRDPAPEEVTTPTQQSTNERTVATAFEASVDVWKHRERVAPGRRAPSSTPLGAGATARLWMPGTPRADELIGRLPTPSRRTLGLGTVLTPRRSAYLSPAARARVAPSSARKRYSLFAKLAPLREKVHAARETMSKALSRSSVLAAARERSQAALEAERVYATEAARTEAQRTEAKKAVAELRELEARVFALKVREEAVAARLAAGQTRSDVISVESSLDEESSSSGAPEPGSGGTIVLLSSDDDESDDDDDQHDPWIDRLAGLLTADETPFVDVMTQPLSATLEEAVDGAFEANDETRLCGVTGFPIHGRDIQTLAPHAWLNDEIINGFYGAVQHMAETHPDSFLRVRTFSSFFYTKVRRNGLDYAAVRRWVKNGDIFDNDRLIFPIHLGNHWTCAVIDLRHRAVMYYDSLGGKNGQCRSTLLRWLDKVHADHRPNDPPLRAADTWRSVAPSVPRQDNTNDCGVFSCQFALASASRDLDAGEDGSRFPFRARDMPATRRRMVALLLKLNAE